MTTIDIQKEIERLAGLVPQSASEKISIGVKLGNLRKKLAKANQLTPVAEAAVAGESVPAEVPPPVDTIEKDAFDAMYFADLRDQSTKLQELSTNETEQTFVSDIFSGLYKHEPKVIENSHKLQKKIIETMLGLQEYKDLRASTELDEISSAIGTIQIGQSMMEDLRKLLEEQEKNKKQKEENGEGEEGEDELSEGQVDQIRRGIRKALKQAQEEVDNAQDALGLLFGSDKAELERTPFNKKLELAKKFSNNNKFKKILDWYGRFANVVMASLSNNYTHGYDEIVDITIGDSIQRLIPSELVKFMTSKTLFYKDLLEGSLFMYDLKGVEPKAKGAMIVCLDVSGSMSGDKEEWAQGVLFAMMLCAIKQRRPFGVICYNESVESTKYYAKTSDIKVEDRIGMFSVSSNGGTNFHDPLEAAFEMRELSSDLKPADIIFITDGEAQLSKEEIKKFQDLKEKTGTKIHGVGIQTPNLSSLVDLLNSEVLVKDLENIDVVKNLVNSSI